MSTNEKATAKMAPFQLEAMLARVDTHPIATLDPTRARARRRVLRALFKTHQMHPFRPCAGGTFRGGEAFESARKLAERELSWCQAEMARRSNSSGE